MDIENFVPFNCSDSLNSEVTICKQSVKKYYTKHSSVSNTSAIHKINTSYTSHYDLLDYHFISLINIKMYALTFIILTIK